jgi:hypothetical protein
MATVMGFSCCIHLVTSTAPWQYDDDNVADYNAQI